MLDLTDLSLALPEEVSG